MNKEKKEILIIDDSVDAIKILIKVLSPEYTVFFSTDGYKGIVQARGKKPDLILLDILMDKINGYDVCKILKNDSETADIPVIFLTAVSESMDEAQAFDIGGADYITKPFVPVVVRARIQNHIRLAEALKELKRLYNLALDANPITGLPGNNSIKNAITAAIETNQEAYIFYADLDNFKAYNDTYGFANGDKVILFTSNLLKSMMKELVVSEGFIGHIGGDDFVFIVEKSNALDFANRFIARFDQGIKENYSAKDSANGYIVSKNRKGEEASFPLVSISIAGVDLSQRKYSNYLEVSDICAELKHMAKQTLGSCLVIDRRM
ncbi:hypothetical protein MASR2M70_21640 [Bacillota bacterium]